MRYCKNQQVEVLQLGCILPSYMYLLDQLVPWLLSVKIPSQPPWHISWHGHTCMRQGKQAMWQKIKITFIKPYNMSILWVGCRLLHGKPFQFGQIFCHIAFLRDAPVDWSQNSYDDLLLLSAYLMEIMKIPYWGTFNPILATIGHHIYNIWGTKDMMSKHYNTKVHVLCHLGPKINVQHLRLNSIPCYRASGYKPHVLTTELWWSCTPSGNVCQ